MPRTRLRFLKSRVKAQGARREPHDGEKARPLHENPTKRSASHPLQLSLPL